MDFTPELTEKPELANYLRQGINKASIELADPFDSPACPKLDADFSKFILMNGLPSTDEVIKEGKAQSSNTTLKQMLVRMFAKLKYDIAEEQIEMAWNDDNTKTTGQAFLALKSEADAKVAALNMNGQAIGKKHIISACTFPDYEKIMKEFDKEDK